jgi:two-component system sensor histidine kinase UhpB
VAGISLRGVASAVVVIVALGRAASGNDDLSNDLVPAQVDAAQLSLLYRDLAVDLASGNASAELVTTAWQSSREVRERMRPLVRHDEALGSAFADVERAADAWIQIATPSSDRIEVSAALPEYADLREALTGLSSTLDARVSERQQEVEDATHAAQLVAAVAGLVLLLAGLAVAVLLRRWITRPLASLIEQTRVVAGGDLAHPIEPSGLDDLASVGSSVETMRARLLDEARRRIDSALIAGHLAESARIAGNLHDDQVQAMTVVSIRLQQLRHQVRDDPELTALVVDTQDAAGQAIERLRRMIFELHSPVLESDGLLTALEVYVDETFGDSVTWDVRGDPGALDAATAGLAYRLAREAIFNVFKHADAKRLDVVVERRPASVVVTIDDDGRGFDVAATTAAAEPGHLGVEHSRQLAEAAGGSWACTSRPGHGTTVRLLLPVAGPDPAAPSSPAPAR